MMTTLPNGKKFYEFRDGTVLDWIRLNFPKMEGEMICRANACPVYDDKEVIISREVFTHNPEYFVFLSYIIGNDDPEHDGWVMRIFEGVTENSPEHLAFMKSFEHIAEGRFVIENQ